MKPANVGTGEANFGAIGQLRKPLATPNLYVARGFLNWLPFYGVPTRKNPQTLFFIDISV